jgi:hypothetical protein
MKPNKYTETMHEAEPLWDGKFPSIATTAAFGDTSSPRPPVAGYDEKLWYVGWTDGATGQPPDDGVRLIRAHDRDRNQRLAEKLNRREARAAAKADASQQRLARTATDLAATRNELAELEMRRRKEPQDFSIVTGVTYVLVALILILSDMPLSLSLVAEGFHMPTKYEIEATDETIVLGDLFSDRWADVLRYLWQPIILAIGIACLGIFFKIITDYFLSSVDALPEERWFARLFKWVRRVFFFSAFALMIVGLYSVGTLRSRQQALDAAQERTLATQGTRPRDAEDPVARAKREAAEAAERAKREREERVRTEAVELWTDVSFILLAITLPVIGGICFSVGWKRIQRFGQLWTARIMSGWRAWRIDRERERQEVNKADAAFLHAEFERLEKRNAEVDLTALGVYMHGYARGFATPQRLEPHRSVYAHCKDVLQQWIAAGVQEITMGRSVKFGRGRK